MSATSQDGGLELIRKIRSLPAKRQRALIALLRQQGVDLSALDGIPILPRSADEPVQLSFTQQRLWFLAQLDGSSPAYNVPVAMRLRGPLDRPALLRALDALVQRHESLRTRFVDRDGVPYQHVGDGRDFTVREEEPANPADVALICAEEAAAPFDLERDPMIRVRLMRQAEDEHVLMVTMHHGVSDGWSVGVFIRDLAALYEAFRAGLPSPLEPLPVQYADYAHWQRQWLVDDVQTRQVEYWRKRLAGIDPRLTLPVDRERPAVKTYRGARERFRCPADLLDRLREVAARHDATLYMTLLAAYSVVLHRHTHQSDIAVGTVVANRNRIEVEGLIGFFANTLVMCADLSGDPAFTELLAQVKKTALEAYDHQDVPFEAVVDALQLERSLSHSPVFQTMFVLQEAETGQEFRPGRLEVSAIEVDVDFTKFDLTLDLRETPDGLVGTVEYNTDLYDRETIQRFVGHYTELLAAIAADPTARTSRLGMLGAAERHQVLKEWNDTDRPFSDDRCLHQLFEQAVERHPDRTALLEGDRSWTYAQLNAWANRIGHALRRRGVGPDTQVGLCLERSAEMVAGIFGILKAGGSYMPIDPSYPAARIAELVKNSGTRVVLTQPHLDAEPLGGTVEVLTLHRDGRILDRDGQAAAYAETDIPVAELGLGPEHLAYVIHTSGSTGRPKGVMIEHRAAVNRIEWMQNEYGLTADDVVLQKTPFSFDVSVWEFFWPLLFGARLAVAEPGGHKDPGYLVEAIQQFGVTTLHFVPSMLRSMVAEPGWSQCTTVRQVFCSGEALPPELCERHYARHTAPLHNLYGPTEAAVDVSHWTCPAARLPRTVPIGRPIQNIRLYVLNDVLEPQGIGCVGELYIAGAGLARGYLHQPELTRERFVPNPFDDAPGARMYRTGDLARWLPDGTLEYLGRADDQVKVRGFRIELGEIEHRLAEHSSVRACAVVVREDQPGNPRLVAYTVLDGEPELADHRAVLTGHLERSLPEYMVPSAFVVVDALPVTAHGKLDRKALPAPGIEDFAQGAYAAPGTETERFLASLWAELLGFDEERISTDDNFFALGGHSLLITVLVARLKAHGLRATVRDVFSASTLAGLAAVIDRTEDGTDFTVPPNLIPPGCERITPDMLPLVDLSQEQIDSIVTTVPRGASNVQDIYPLASTQEGILFHHLMDPDNDPYLVSTLYVADDETACTRFTEALQAVVDRHDAMRTAVVTDDLSEPVQVVYRTAAPTVERTRLDPDGDPEQQARALLDRFGRMAIDRAPLLRLVIAEDPNSERRYLLLNAHHLIEDATSLRLTLEELGAHMAGRAELLPPPAPYRDFVAHVLHQRDPDEAEAYFRGVLGDVTEPTTPFGLTDVRGDGRRVLQHRRSLAPGLTRDLRAQAQRLHLSPACLFHAAWALVVGACSGRDDVVFGAVMSGRLQGVPGVERMLGNFINTLPMRTRLAGRTVRELITDVDTALKDLITHEQSPLSLAQRCSDLDGDAPLFSAVVNVRHFEPGHGEVSVAGINDCGVRFLTAGDAINYPVTVSLDDFGSEFSLDVQVDESVACEAVADYVETALSGIVDALATDGGEGTVALDVEVLPAAERRRLLTEWNGSAVDVTATTLLAPFEAQVERSPDRTALVFEGETLSYAELNARANRLAHWLTEQGAGPERLVAVRMERSFDLVTAVYAVLKTGAAYLPVEPDLPAERVEQMLADSKPLLVLEELPDTSGHPESNPGVTVSREHPAYVFYTSGSTGRPKGVVISHRAGLNWLSWNQRRYRLRDSHRLLLKTSVGFDVSVPELFWALQVGASLVIARPDGHRDPAYLARLISEQDVTDVYFAPSMLAAFLAEPAAARCTGLRRVEAVGETLPVELAERLTRALPGVELYNGYGPTEAGAVTAWQYRAEPGATGVPIGTVVPNVQVYVLNPALRPVPPGVAGELYIAGDGLAHGYLNRPELTAERFVANPFTPGARMYRTGDLAMRRPDGVLEYLGRIDDQVKVRGFRVEPGEITNVLLSHPAVHGAVVVPQAVGDTRGLVAYVSPDQQWLETVGKEYTEDLDRWQRHFEDEYTADAPDPAGRHSESGGGPTAGIGAREHVDATVRRIEELRPKRLLEVGCGTGTLLFRYAPLCASVHALDLSSAALDAVHRGVARRGWSHVTLSQGDALTVSDLAGQTFDTIVLDSVVQYFPNRHYLDEAIGRLLPLLDEGGSIVVGDVRNLDLFPALACAAERRRTHGPVTAGALAAQVERARSQESELLVSPTYFAGLTERFPELGTVDLLLRHAAGDDGILAADRYDVILTKGVTGTAEALPWLEAATPAALRSLLDGGTPDRFGVGGLSNPRVTDEVRAWEDLRRGSPSRTVQALPDGDRPSPWVAESVRDLAAVLRHAGRLGYQVSATWSQDRLDGLDLVFSRHGSPRVRARARYGATRLTNMPQIGRLGPSTARMLKEHLSASLPHYMIPSAFVIMEELPVTPNGKIDKRALPVPDEGDVAKEAYVAPATGAQQTLCRIIAEVLGLTRVGLQDNFFDLGGHSLLATRLILQVKKETDAELPLQLIFSGATVEDLADALEQDPAGPRSDEPDTAADVREPGAAPLSLQQRDLWFLNRPEHLGTAHYNVQLAFRVEGALDRDAYARAVRSLVERHAVLRTSYVRHEGVVTQRVNDSAGYEVSVLEAASEEAATEWLRAERARPFAADDTYMIRAYLLALSDTRHLAVLTRPWGVFDGWSVNIVLAELVETYRALSQGGEPNLPALSLQYADFARRQHRMVDAAELSRQEEYWRRQLDGLPACLSLRTDYRRPPVKSHQGSSVQLQVPFELLGRLRRVCQEQNVTLYMLLLSAYAVLVGGHAEDDDLAIGTAVTNRPGADLEQLVGYCVNLLVLRLDVAPDRAFSDVLAQARRVTTEAHQNQDLPFAELAGSLAEPDPAHSPLFQVMFNLLPAPATEAGDGGGATDLEISPLPTEAGTARYDLNLVVRETDSGLEGNLEYSTDLFARSTAEDMARSYEQLLRRIAAAPESGVTRLRTVEAHTGDRPDGLGRHPTGRSAPADAPACPVTSGPPTSPRPAEEQPAGTPTADDTPPAQDEPPRPTSKRRHTSMAPTPPTMAGHPVFGSLMDLQRDTLGTYLKAQREHGDVVRFTAGLPGMRGEFYAVFSASGAQQVLAASAQTFTKENRFLGELRASFGNGLLTSMGDEYLRQRRLLQSLFTPRQVDNYGSEITHEAQLLAERWSTVPDATVDVAEEMTGHTLRTITRILFGTKSDVDTMVRTVQRNFPLINAYAVKRAFGPFHLSRKVPTPGNLRAAKAHQELYDVCDAIIAARQAEESEAPTDRHDMLSLLARAQGEDGAPISAKETRDQVLIFLITGHESTATTLGMALHLLAAHPEALARAHHEVDTVLAGREPAAADMDDLAYLVRVIKETLRLYPAAPAQGRVATENAQVGDYAIPKGANVVISSGVVHRHPDIWEDPDRFDPDRFLPEREAERPRYAWFPFGGGPRACIGQHLATLEAVLTLAVLLQRYSFTPVDLDIPLNTGITLRPTGQVRCKLTPRD
ncbi:non-ribosomal peptide synthetase [Streptomyces avermitilis]|nr:non-ribosomal peptide synthetase [Streptomyces avermitilis]OOV21929.1 non-ribosomal peptide synthetase [Streptomyces avermitilis]BBA21073.1 putative non-ribosomal peptide synthetase [Streptomyces avermitilis]GDY68151.1 hypothetical protein SAV14893_075440 [Streptomyces avermitilis]